MPEISENREESCGFYNRNAEIFLVAARLLSFSAAAKQMGITQSSVSQAIKILENSLQIELFERETRPIKLTQAGKILFQALQKEKVMLKGLISICQDKYNLRPTVEIGLIESIATSIAVPLLESLQTYVSRTKLRTGVSEKLLREVENRELEMAVIASQTVKDDDLNWYLLYEEPWALIFPQGYPVKKDASWEELKTCGLPFIHHGRHTANGKVFRILEEKLGLEFPRIYELDSNLLMLKLVQAGKGWTITQCQGVLSSMDVSGVQILRAPALTPKRKVFMVTRRDYDERMASLIYSKIRTLIQEKLEIQLSPLIPGIVEEFAFGKMPNESQQHSIFWGSPLDA